MKKINPRDYPHITVLTGAGVSVASGLGTYRGRTAVPEGKKPPTIDTFQEDPMEIWRLFAPRKEAVLAGEPNPAHLALARLEKEIHAAGSFNLITQNVDGFHGRAGSRNVVEMHGYLFRTRCGDIYCDFEPFLDEDLHLDELPRCPVCSSPLRPDVVLFGETIKMRSGWLADAMRECDLFIAAGTSGTVYPAANYVRRAKNEGRARTLLVNLEPTEGDETIYDDVIYGKVEEVLPELFEWRE